MQRKNFSQVHPNSKQIFSKASKKKFLCQRKIKLFIWIEWEKSPRNFFALPSQQFQVLFYSPFEVLFIFPSQYFFAIGLLSIFSFGWITPPILSCISKQLDSKKSENFFRVCLWKITGLSPSLVLLSSKFIFHSSKISVSKRYNSLENISKGFSAWAFSFSLAVTNEIIVIFFSST